MIKRILLLTISLLLLYYPILFIHSILNVYTLFSMSDSLRNNSFIYYLSFCAFMILMAIILEVRKYLINKLK